MAAPYLTIYEKRSLTSNHAIFFPMWIPIHDEHA